jgi:biopolymer transport protein ExbD
MSDSHGGGGGKRIAEESSNAGFQIAPMIDVVFVIMLYFMVMAGKVTVEKELKMALPGQAQANVTQDTEPEEVTVRIEESGVVTLNDEEMDQINDKTLPTFVKRMYELKQTADARGAKVVVTVEAEEQAKYDRVIDVLNAMAFAQITNVSFTVGSEEF